MSEFGPGWTTDLASATPAPAPSYTTPSGYELRPLSTGEILDRTFALYRQNFWLYAGLSAMAAAVASVSQVIQYALSSVITRTSLAAPGHVDWRTISISLSVTFTASIIFLAAYSVTQAATTAAVSSIYLGHETSIPLAFGKSRAAWFRYILISLWQDWSGLWVIAVIYVAGLALVFTSVTLKITALAIVGGLLFILLLPASPYGVIAYIRNALAIPSSVVENLKVRKTMRRSKDLTSGTKGRIFLLFLLLFAMKLVAFGIQVPIAIVLQRSHAGQRILAEGLSVILAFLTTTVIGPIGAIGLCLFYFDQRVRNEGFDIEALMERSLGIATEPPPVEPDYPGLV